MIKLKINIVLILILFSATFIFGSDLIIRFGRSEKKIPSIQIKGIEYVPSKALANVFSANYYYNEDRQKSEIKFKDYKLKFTVNNQFIILTSKKSNQNQIFQMPVSSRADNDDVIIPIKYALKYLGYASGMEMKYNADQNVVEVQNVKVDTKSLVSWNKNLIDANEIKYDINQD